MRAVVAVLFALSACDQALGFEVRDRMDAGSGGDGSIDAPDLDLDRDGTGDSVDLCIAPADEGATTDQDVDTILDAVDKCPFHPVNGVDGVDMDGIGSCDPFPTVVNRARCLMLFTSSALNSALWRPRQPDEAWSNEPTKLIAAPPTTGSTLATTIVAQSMELAGITTYEALVELTRTTADGSITLWLRADPTAPSSSDVGCRYASATGNGFFAVVQGAMSLATDGTMPLPAGVTTGVLRGRIVATGALGSSAQINCELLTPGFTAESAAAVQLPEGRMGFTVDRWKVAIRGLHIID